MKMRSPRVSAAEVDIFASRWAKVAQLSELLARLAKRFAHAIGLTDWNYPSNTTRGPRSAKA